jgi:hypothetical protein
MAERFLNACQDLGVTKILFIRHANSLPISGANRQDQPHDWKFRDQTRLLSDKGKDQCLNNRSLITDFEIKANLTSPARRASETAARLTIGPDGGDIFLRMIESLHPAGMSATCEDLFDSMGYGPVRIFSLSRPSFHIFSFSYIIPMLANSSCVSSLKWKVVVMPFLHMPTMSVQSSPPRLAGRRLQALVAAIP